ncbi:unnamed protein product, partial [Candidula unifasciata]
LSQNLTEFYCIMNGDFTDKGQLEKDGSSRTPIDVRLVPVVAPALSPLPVIYIEEFSDLVLIRAVIQIVTEGDDGVVYTVPHNFKGNTDIKPGTFDVSKIKSLTPADLQGRQECKDVFVRTQQLVFSVNYALCNKEAVNGQHASYGATITCDEDDTLVPAGAPEKSTLVPYRIRRHGQKYPLEDAPGNYVCNCDNSSD